jgi:hypothetical protein
MRPRREGREQQESDQRGAGRVHVGWGGGGHAPGEEERGRLSPSSRGSIA